MQYETRWHSKNWLIAKHALELKRAIKGKQQREQALQEAAHNSKVDLLAQKGPSCHAGNYGVSTDSYYKDRSSDFGKSSKQTTGCYWYQQPSWEAQGSFGKIDTWNYPHRGLQGGRSDGNLHYEDCLIVSRLKNEAPKPSPSMKTSKSLNFRITGSIKRQTQPTQTSFGDNYYMPSLPKSQPPKPRPQAYPSRGPVRPVRKSKKMKQITSKIEEDKAIQNQLEDSGDMIDLYSPSPGIIYEMITP